MRTRYYEDAPYIKSMVSCLSKVVDDGYKEEFKVTSLGIRSAETNRLYTPNQVRLVNFFRFEGFSDPKDNAVLYVIETDDGVKGTIIDACSDADPLIYKFILEVSLCKKKPLKN